MAAKETNNRLAGPYSGVRLAGVDCKLFASRLWEVSGWCAMKKHGKKKRIRENYLRVEWRLSP